MRITKRDGRTRVRVCAAVGTAAAVLSTIGAAGAQAAPPTFHCEASPLRASIAGAPAIEPVTQGRTGDCATGSATPTIGVPPLINATALTASTTFDGAAAAGSAAGGVTHLDLLPAPEILARGRQQIIDVVNTLPLTPITLPGLPSIPGLPGLSGVTLDLRAALVSLIPAAAPSLLSADVLNARADVACQAGGAAFSGASNVVGLNVLGQSLGVDGVLDTVLPLIDGRSVTLSQLLTTGLVKVYDPTGLIQLVNPIINQALAALPLNAIPPLQIPAALAAVHITPNEQIADGSSLTQRALHATIALGGQQILDATVGEAKVSATDGTCAAPTTPPPTTPPANAAPKPDAPVGGQSVADQLLACSDRKLVLVDVLKRNGRVQLLGAANRDYIGKQVAIRLRATGKVVARATVRKDGSFQTTAPLPARAALADHKRANRLRYRAEIGKELSLPLKLQRRLVVESLTAKDGKVTIAGHVVAPLTTPVSTIRLVRRVSCHKVVLVKRFTPRADGTFKVTVKAPAGQAAAVYRMATNVREKPGNPRSYPTFTLPRGVALNTR